MHIISRKKLTDYYQDHPLSKVALEEWFTRTKASNWTCFADIKNTFNSVDSVGNRHYVFNIKRNDFRLIVVIHFIPGKVYIRFVGTHAEYDKINASTI